MSFSRTLMEGAVLEPVLRLYVISNIAAWSLEGTESDKFGPRYRPKLGHALLRLYDSKPVRLCSGTRAVHCPLYGMAVIQCVWSFTVELMVRQCANGSLTEDGRSQRAQIQIGGPVWGAWPQAGSESHYWLTHPLGGHGPRTGVFVSQRLLWC
jgi:hypothetical protein